MSPEAAHFPPTSFACPTLALREKAHLAVGSAITLANFAFAVAKVLTSQNHQTPFKAAALRLFAQSSHLLS